MDDLTTTSIVAAAAVLLAVLVACVLAAAMLRMRSQQRRASADAAEVQAELLARIEALERPEPSPVNVPSGADVTAFVITDVGRETDVPHTEPTRIEGRLFADLVLRETVVKAASWTHGVRTALSAENRHRVRFEVKRETKRSRKQRKADVKEALRQYYARQDAGTGEDLA